MTDKPQTERDKILFRIGKLRLHAESTNSEAEAMTFAEKAASLMAAYEVSEAELAEAEADGRVVFDIVELKASGVRKANNTARWKAAAAHRAVSAVSAINKLTNTKSVLTRDDERSVTFLGHRPDAEFAVFLYDIIRDAMDREYENWRKTQRAVGRTAKGAFQMAMVRRISERLYTIARENRAAREAAARGDNQGDNSAPVAGVLEDRAEVFMKQFNETAAQASKALVLVDAKQQEVHSAFKAKYPRLGTASGFRHSYNGNASAAGRAAGDRVGLNRGIGSGSASKQLTRG